MAMKTLFAVALLAALGTSYAQQKSAMSDAQIAQIVVTANSIDIENGKIALNQSKTASIDEFANLMIKDHTAVNKNATALVTRLGVKPEPSETSKSLQSSADAEQAKLRGLKGHDFDKAYLENEVAYHKQVLGAISDALIPNAQNAELKKMLVDVKPAFQAHLDHAEKTLAELDKKH
jgi:putative membrane protein